MSAARPVPGFPAYEVTEDGRVFSTRPWRGTARRELRGRLDSSGYRQVNLCPGDGRSLARSVHALVAEVFLGPRPAGLEVRHLDGDQTNNHVSNLCYGTRAENMQDMVRHGTHWAGRLTHCKHNHPFDESNTYYTSKGVRHCRTCGRLRRRARVAALKGEQAQGSGYRPEAQQSIAEA